MSEESHSRRSVSTALFKTDVGKEHLPDFVLAEYFSDAAKVITPDDLEHITIDQQQRWLQGQRLSAEAYVARFPELRLTHDHLFDLIYSEFLLLELLGPPPDVESFAKRFPDLANELRAQVAFHEAIEAISDCQDSNGEEQPPADQVPANCLSLPDFLGRYRPVRKLGSGGMGDVYLAEDLQLERQVAIKLPRVDGTERDRVNARFLREAKALAALQHPNISQIYDFGRDGDQLFIVMRYLPGQTLQEFLKDEPRPATQVSLQIVTKIAMALEVAHRLGIAHRDLKPSNIMLNNTLEPTIMDFGLVATRSLEAQRLTSQNIIAGTPAYISPERINAPDACDGFRSDIYSLGVVLYEMLAGRLPYEATNTTQMLAHILTETPKPPSAWNPTITAEIDAICMKAIAKSASDRYSSMHEFSAVLLESKGDKPKTIDTSADTPTLTSKIQTGRRRVPLLFLSGAFVLCGVFGYAMFAVRKLSDRGMVLLQGETLVGSFRFLPDGPEGDVELTINQVNGRHFVGTYRTENGEYVWSVEGKAVGTKLDFQLVKALTPSAEFAGVDGQARVSGEVSDSRFAGKYQDGDSEAVISMLRHKPATASK